MNAYKLFYWSSLITAAIAIASAAGLGDGLKVVLSYMCIASLVVTAIISSGFIYHWGKFKINALLVLGSLFIFFGAVFDIFATLYNSPDLTYEANPIARTFLDSGLSSGAVIVIGFVAQASFIVISLLLWANFIVRLDWYKEVVRESSGISLVGRIFGAMDSRFSSLFGARVNHEVAVSSAGFLVMFIFVYRWYLGFEWFGVVPISRIAMPVIILVLSFSSIFIWGLILVRSRK